MTTPDVLRADVPAEGENPDGRIVIPATPVAAPADPAIYGEGLARTLDAIAAVLPREEVEAAWVFPGVVREGKEYGVVVVARRGDAERQRVYRARYTLQVKGQDRGRIAIEVEETAAAPAELVPRVIDGVARRADEAGDADPVDLAPWKAAGGDAAS